MVPDSTSNGPGEVMPTPLRRGRRAAHSFDRSNCRTSRFISSRMAVAGAPPGSGRETRHLMFPPQIEHHSAPKVALDAEPDAKSSVCRHP